MVERVGTLVLVGHVAEASKRVDMSLLKPRWLVFHGIVDEPLHLQFTVTELEISGYFLVSFQLAADIGIFVAIYFDLLLLASTLEFCL